LLSDPAAQNAEVFANGSHPDALLSDGASGRVILDPVVNPSPCVNCPMSTTAFGICDSSRMMHYLMAQFSRLLQFSKENIGERLRA
jgi:hypothetical protein